MNSVPPMLAKYDMLLKVHLTALLEIGVTSYPTNILMMELFQTRIVVTRDMIQMMMVTHPEA